MLGQFQHSDQRALIKKTIPVNGLKLSCELSRFNFTHAGCRQLNIFYLYSLQITRLKPGSHQGGSKNRPCTLKVFWEDWYAREISVSSAIKYDCFKLDDSLGNCIIRKTWLHCI